MAVEELVVAVDEPWAAESAAGEPCGLPVIELVSVVVELELTTPEAVGDVELGPTSAPEVGIFRKVILMVFSCFFQDLFEFVRHCNKIHIFLCLFVLFAHYY